MRMLLLWMAALAMPVVVGAVDTLPIHNELVYTTTTACDRITKPLPQQHELAGLLLPNTRLEGAIALTKQVADVKDPTKCMLRLQVKGVLEGGVENVFDVARSMDQQVTELVETQYLRGTAGRLQDLKLQRIHVMLSKREYVMNLEPRNDQADVPQSQVTMSHGGTTCSTLESKGMLHEILPNGLVNLDAIKTEPLVLNQGAPATQCAVGLNLVTHVSPFGSNEDAFAFLETVDDRLKGYFGLDARVDGSKGPLLSRATMHFVVNPSTLLLATNLRGAETVNPPTKAIAMGLVMGMALLGMMLMGMTYQKKRHDQHCQERYDKASRVAQIHRVSYRMGYGRVSMKEEEEEEEKDGLL